MEDISKPIITSDEPILVKWNNEPIEITERLTIVNHSATLRQIPDTYQKVKINGYSEVFEPTKVGENQFYVDYNMGIVYFNENIEDKTVVNAHYYGRGILLFPASRIYAHTTNGDVSTSIQDLIDNYNNLNGVDLYTKFDPQAGHIHSGNPGDAPRIPAEYIPIKDDNNIIEATNVEGAFQEFGHKIENNQNEVVQARTKADGTTFPLLKDRLNDIDEQLADNAIFVNLFGAVGDGTTDDTQAIINALNYAKSLGYQKVKFQKGKTYKVSNKIPITFDNVELDGQGSTVIFENQVNVNNDVQYWQSVFYAVGTEDVNTKAIIAGYETINNSEDGQGNLVRRGRWTVSTTNGFNVGDYVFINIPLDQTIKDYSDARPACQIATRIIDIDTTNNYIDTEYFTPFDWSKRVWYGTETLWKIIPIKNITIKNINFIDNNPEVLRSISINDTLENRQKQLSAIGGKYVVGFNVENIHVKYNHQQAVVTYGCIGVSVKNVECEEPKYLADGQGYCCQFKHSYNIVVENIRGYKVRHLVDFTASAFAKVTQCFSSHEFNYAFDVHGFCEHNITFENCIGSLEVSNSVQYFPNMSKDIVFDKCDINSAFLNWSDGITFKNSHIVFLGINAIADIKILDVGKIVFENCRIEVPNNLRFKGEKRGIAGFETCVKLIDCNINGLKDGTETASGGIFVQTLDLFEMRSNYFDLSDLNTQVEIRDVERVISRDNIFKNTYVFIQGDSSAIWNLDYNSYGDTFDIDDNCKRLIVGLQTVPFDWRGAKNRIGKINVKDITFKLRSNTNVIDFINLPNGGTSLQNSKIFVTYDGVDVEIFGSANVRAYIGQFLDIIFTFKNWQYRSIGTGSITYGGAYNLASVYEMDHSFPVKYTSAPTGYYNNPYSGQIVWNSAATSGKPIGWIWNGTAFVALPNIP